MISRYPRSAHAHLPPSTDRYSQYAQSLSSALYHVTPHVLSAALRNHCTKRYCTSRKRPSRHTDYPWFDHAPLLLLASRQSAWYCGSPTSFVLMAAAGRWPPARPSAPPAPSAHPRPTPHRTPGPHRPPPLLLLPPPPGRPAPLPGGQPAPAAPPAVWLHGVGQRRGGWCGMGPAGRHVRHYPRHSYWLLNQHRSRQRRLAPVQVQGQAQNLL